MMGGYPFIYNKISSELYNASIVFISESYTNRPSGSGVEMITESIRRNPQVLYLDGMQSPPLEFNVEIVFDEPVDIFEFTQIKDWLGGEITYKELQICAENFEDFFFRCYITLEGDLIYAGGYRGVKATVHCDAPWAWQNEEEVEYTFDDTSVPHLIQCNNLSADSEYLRPILEITSDQAGDCSIVNISFDKRETKFTNLMQGETITLDNLNGFIESNTGLRRVSNFNKVFFKLIKGMNDIAVGTNISKIKIKYQNAKRIGGGFY